jgi:hypothetical protein
MRGRTTKASWLLVLGGAAAAFATAVAAGVLGEPWNVGDVDHPGQRTVYAPAREGARFGLPIAGGDVDGNGNADLLLTPMNADSGPGRSRSRAGEAIFVLDPYALDGSLDLATIDPDDLPPTITVVWGAEALDFFGTQAATGDLDADGYDDAIIGAQLADGLDNMRPGSGEVVIVWGGPDIGGRRIDLNDLQPDDPVTRILGADAGDRLGIWTYAGDFDGDGFPDAVLGADQGSGPENSRTHAGETFIVYGGEDLRRRRTLDLQQPDAAVTRIAGIDPEDHSGCTVRATDLNGDGAAEVLIGAGLQRSSATVSNDGGPRGHAIAGGDRPDNDTRDAGEAYVVYGSVGVRPAFIDLADPPASTVIVYGVDAFDAYGEEVYGGDFDGDGFGDLLVGAITADSVGNQRPNAGELALIPGGPSLPGSVIDLASPPANTTIFYGAAFSDIAGDTAFLADFDLDGKDDLFLASPNSNPEGRVGAGSVALFFGTDVPLPPVVDLDNLPAELLPFAIIGSTPGDMVAYSSAYADVNGDGRTDALLNAMGGDGFDDLLRAAGDVYILDGRILSEAAGRATPAPTPTAAPITCVGDCDNDGTVTVDELVSGINIALGLRPIGDCPRFDGGGDGQVTVDEILEATNNALGGCP